MNTKLVIREDRGSIAILTLNRPERRNALSRALVAELRDILDHASAQDGVRVVILTGSGSVFCAGMDLKEAAAAGESAESERETIAIMEQFADLIQRLHTLKKPTVAALNGDALAGGAGLMAACDFVVAAESAAISYPEVKRGLVASIVMHDLSRQVGDRRARQLLLSAEPITAHVAKEWGLVNEVVPAQRCLDEAIRLGNELAKGAPGAIAATKRLLDEAMGRPHDLRGAAAVSAAVRVSDEAREGIRAFVEKRAPAWSVSRSDSAK
jgi:methylglutaconyl-CoA hydratase